MENITSFNDDISVENNYSFVGTLYVGILYWNTTRMFHAVIFFCFLWTIHHLKIIDFHTVGSYYHTNLSDANSIRV